MNTTSGRPGRGGGTAWLVEPHRVLKCDTTVLFIEMTQMSACMLRTYIWVHLLLTLILDLRHHCQLKDCVWSLPASRLPQVPTCLPTALRSARPWATLTAAGCPALSPRMGGRPPTTAATCTCLAWTRSPTQRYFTAELYPLTQPLSLQQRRHQQLHFNLQLSLAIIIFTTWVTLFL